MAVNVVSVIAIIGMVACLVVAFHKSISYISVKSMGYFLPLMAIGTGLNFMALIISGGEPLSLAFLHSIGLSLDIFKLKISVSTVAKLANEYILFQIAIWLYDVLAMFATVAFVISLFFHTKLNDLRIRLAKNEDKYILIGDGENLNLLFQDLRRNKQRVIYVAPNISKEDKKRFADNKILYFEGNYNEKTFSKIGIIVKNKAIRLVSIFVKDQNSFNASIALSNYLEAQIQINADAYESCQFDGVFFYTNTERTEHFHFVDKFGGRIKYVSKYDLLARKFIMEHPITQYLPRELINTEAGVLVDNVKISHMFVGLGNANMQLLKKVACDNQFINTDFNAYIFDKKIHDAYLTFKNIAKGFFDQNITSNDDYPIPNEKINIIEKEINAVTSVFYDDLVDIVSRSDFTVAYICLGEDLLNLETALELRQQLICKNIAGKVRIFFKSNKKIAQKQMELINANCEQACPLTPFAENEAIFTANIIINETLDYVAKRLNNVYNEKALTDDEIEENWNKLAPFKQDSNRYAAYGIKFKLNLLGYDIIDDGNNSGFQDLQHLLRSPKEEELIKMSKEDKSIEEFIRDDDGAVDRRFKRNNLARLEHQRWNVYYLASGWTQMALKDIYYDATLKKLVRDKALTKEHSCLTTFDGLDILTQYSVALLEENGVSHKDALIMSETIKYDFNVMDNLEKVFRNTGYSIVKLK